MDEDDNAVFSVLENRWAELYEQDENGVYLMSKLFKGATFRAGYEFKRMYGHITSAAREGEISYHYSSDFIRTIKDNKIIAEDRKFTNVSSIDKKREYLTWIIDRDPVVGPFLNLIDKGDELILEIRKPKTGTDTD